MTCLAIGGFITYCSFLVWLGYWNLKNKKLTALPVLRPAVWLAQSLPHDCSNHTSGTVVAWSAAPCIDGPTVPVTGQVTGTADPQIQVSTDQANIFFVNQQLASTRIRT